MIETQVDSVELNKIIEAESTNFQWVKQGLNLSLILIFFTTVSLMKGGSSPSDSIIGIIKCETIDWALFTTL